MIDYKISFTKPQYNIPNFCPEEACFPLTQLHLFNSPSINQSFFLIEIWFLNDLAPLVDPMDIYFLILAIEVFSKVLLRLPCEE